LRMRAGDGTGAPDAVVLPGGHDEVTRVLRLCAAERVAVVPYGGGTSVVGGLTAARDGFTGVISLDLSRMNRLVAVDTETLTAVFEPGVRAPGPHPWPGEQALRRGASPQPSE